MEVEELRELAEKLERARFSEGTVEVDVDALDTLLRIVGRAIAEMDMGNIYTAREILSEMGEIIYKAMKSFLNEH
ncbi:hypothetical protein GAH_01883 [Geoglobus ahangari]|uniref:Uncharacterized protein n=1 Tax=Geoglobus ahangari TaxID=113653 RepID=A0A0F7ID46_9EURY|nr:hypothetical protein [Geoglobus ahangari]AKG90840.1 hypothetical protein GAH_01883 [Geoglobus ahangari]